MRDQLLGVAVFWHEDEAFVFLDRHATARSTNAVLERLPQSGWWAAVAGMSADWRPLGHATTAYRLATGVVDRYDLPDTVIAPSWDLDDGRLVARARTPADEGRGFRWTGSDFLRLPALVEAPSPRVGARTLEADDEEDEGPVG